MNESNQLQVIQEVPNRAIMLQEFNTLEGILQLGKTIAESGMFGCRNEAQAATLMLLAQSEGQHPFMALRKWHLIEGKPSMKAEAMIAEMKAKTTGGLIWHVRSDSMAGATFFEDRSKIDDEARQRAAERFKAQWKMDMHKDNGKIQAECVEKLADLSRDGEVTVIRYAADEFDKGVSATWKNQEKVLKDNWARSPRQMLTARVSSEGVRLVASGVIVGIYSTEEEQDMLQDRLALPRSRGDIEAEITRIREEALNAKGSERQRLLALVANLQHQLEGMPGGETADEAMERINQETKKEPEAEKPTPVVEAEAEVVQETKKEPAPAKPRPQEEPLPGGEPGSGKPAHEPWMDHAVEFIALAGIKGKKVGELTPQQVRTCKTRWCDKYAELIAKDQKKIVESKALLQAYRHHEQAGAYTETASS